MMPKEDPATNSGGVGGNAGSSEDPQLGEAEQGTEAGHEEEDTTAMNVNRPAQQ